MANFKRLIYSPKAFVFITSRTQADKDGKPKVYDVSDYVVSGRVNRLLDQPSTAEFTLKNRFFEFSANNKDGPVFLPQDGVTIWLQRISGRPIQVFTGYLDQVPYYQMYPGVGTFKATCTLKRLEHVLFDPGLPSTMQFMANNGWTVDPSSGAVIGQQIATGLGATGGHANDGGFGVLLSRFMKDIAGWDPTTIWVSDLPTSIAKRSADIYGSVWRKNQIEAASLEGFLKSLMSISVVNESSNIGPPATQAISEIRKAASREGVSPFLMVLSSLVLSGMYPYYKNSDPNAMGYGAGLYSATPDVARNTTNVAPDQTDLSQQNQTYGGFTETEIMKAENAAKVFAKKLRTAIVTGHAGGSTNLLSTDPEHASTKSVAEAIGSASGKSEYKAMIQEAVIANWSAAKTYLGTSDNADLQVTTFWQIDTASTNDNVTWATLSTLFAGSQYPSSVQSALKDEKYKSLSTTNNRAAAYIHVGATHFGLIPTSYHGDGEGTFMMIKNAADADVAGYALWAATQHTNRGSVEVWSSLGPATSYTKNTKFGTLASPVTPIRNPGDWVAIKLSNNTNPPDPPYFDGRPIFSATGTASSSAANVKKDFTFEDLVKTDFASAFTSRFAFPTNIEESLNLTGDKSFMNDIPVMEAVKTIAKGSMRRFMSMPTGDFLAFYPDYFGADGRKPYWNIHDVEIINMGINLSDDALATHVYVVGSTTGAADISFLERSLTAGVITLEQIFNAHNFISGPASFFSGKGGKSKGQFSTAVDNAGNIGRFFQIYGVRPKRIENPFIRSHWFEFLSAIQTFMYMWTMQFATTAEFTFQPEIFAGGRVGFPEHQIECFVESVTHTWNYESGFETNAVLTSPVTTNKGAKNYPGFAITSGIGSEGVSTGM